MGPAGSLAAAQHLGLQVATLEQRGPDRHDRSIRGISRTLPQSPDLPVIRITDRRYAPPGIHHRCEKDDGRLDTSPERSRELIAIGTPAQCRGEQELQ